MFPYRLIIIFNDGCKQVQVQVEEIVDGILRLQQIYFCLFFLNHGFIVWPIT